VYFGIEKTGAAGKGRRKNMLEKRCKMKEKIVIDLGRMMDEVFEAAQDIREAVQDGFKETVQKGEKVFQWDENIDYYPAYSYPPVNAYLTVDKELVFEFALAGFDESSMNLEFSGDYMIFSAKVDQQFQEKKDFHYFKHRLKLKDIREQKYYVPRDKFDQTGTRAVYKNGILVVEIPPKEGTEDKEKVRVDIKTDNG